MEDSNRQSALPPGTKVREFLIEKTLGSGGFGIVYSAMHEILRETVAIKEFLPSDLARRRDDIRVEPRDGQADAYAWAREKFLQEARTLKALAEPDPHPNLVQVIHAFPENDTIYMCMRYEEGEPLEQILTQRGPLSESELRSILFPLLSGLERAHLHGVLHRDIKPANILIRANGSPVLIDFGAARQELSNRDRSVMAQCTPGYAAPEQLWSGDEQGPWTDIYALGATLYRSITGAAPHGFSRSTLREDYRGTYSDSFLAAIDAALELKPADRPQTVKEWRAQFDAIPAQPLEANAPTVVRPTTAGVDRTRVMLNGRPSAATDVHPATGKTSAGALQRIRKAPPWPWILLGAVMIGVGGLALWRWYPLLLGGPEPAPPPSVQLDGQVAPALTGSPQALPHTPDGAAVPLPDAAGTLDAGGAAPPSASGWQEGPRDPGRAAADRADEGGSALPESVSPISPGRPVEAAPKVGQGSEGTVGAVSAVSTLGKIRPLLASLGCARLQPVLSPSGSLKLSGFVERRDDLDALRSGLLAAGYSDPLDASGIEIIGSPFCQIIATLQDAAKGMDPKTKAASIAFNKDPATYREGDYLVVRVVNQNPQDGYLYLDYVDNAGEVVHMLPTRSTPNNRVAASGEAIVGAEDEQICARRQCYEIFPPHGTSLVLAIWSADPLMSEPRRDDIEPAWAYAQDLASAIQRTHATGNAGIALSYQVVRTRP